MTKNPGQIEEGITFREFAGLDVDLINVDELFIIVDVENATGINAEEIPFLNEA